MNEVLLDKNTGQYIINMDFWSQGIEILKEPNCLIAGVPGSGKSVLLDSLIYSLCGLGNSFVLALIDLKKVQLRKWSLLPHCREKIMFADSIEKAKEVLDIMLEYMDSRYEKMMRSFQEQSTETPVYIIIDELADLMTYKGIEERLLRLIRLGRASNIHLIMATQSPNRSVITKNIQSCITSAIGLHCRSGIESRQIIKVSGCEELPRVGQGLFEQSGILKKIKIPMFDREAIMKRIELWTALFNWCNKHPEIDTTIHAKGF